ncbi:hypothetical protein AFL01nite_05180 [Aeromicrobium flavum]|uniref:FtsK domain-containing protein n=1 Tax=Aeromicrobium flavum TaxID=416568 RepID=A0A512HRV6_9ACTN|nr:DNA translocase FtsK [Aeromicrobium flavum]GEO88191.1 hypothetical protein AFL01nite_05180 [Aeromicrobium flavum]
MTPQRSAELDNAGTGQTSHQAAAVLGDAARSLLIEALDGRQSPEHDAARQILARTARALLLADLGAPVAPETAPASARRPRKPRESTQPPAAPPLDTEAEPETIARALAQHGVSVAHVETIDAPQVHRHAFTLAAGVRVSRVAALTAEIESALDRDGVAVTRQGKHVLIDVPRSRRTFVKWSRDRDREGSGSTKAPLSFVAGHGLDDQPVTVDLATCPHLLIAGSTGSGKSVAVHGLIASLLDRSTPDTLRLTLVDPKRVELGQWASAPQVEQFVSGGGWEAAHALAVVETVMDNRFSRFADAGVRDIEEYRVAHPDRPMPAQVVVIDELADLMLDKSQRAEIEISVVRIAQLGRAAGVHLVLATQRPTVKVVTGLIGANVPARWVFRVNSGVDSRVALGRNGAELLLGKGDGLLSMPGRGIVRVQAPAIGDSDVAGVLDRSRATFPPREVDGVQITKPPTSLDE